MTERAQLRPDYGYAFCAYGCSRRATFYVGHDEAGTYTCAGHLAHFVRQFQADVPTEWLAVCLLTRETDRAVNARETEQGDGAK